MPLRKLPNLDQRLHNNGAVQASTGIIKHKHIGWWLQRTIVPRKRRPKPLYTAMGNTKRPEKNKSGDNKYTQHNYATWYINDEAISTIDHILNSELQSFFPPIVLLLSIDSIISKLSIKGQYDQSIQSQREEATWKNTQKWWKAIEIEIPRHNVGQTLRCQIRKHGTKSSSSQAI